MSLIGQWTLAVLWLAASVPGPAPAEDRAHDLRGRWTMRMTTFSSEERQGDEMRQGWIGSWPALEWPDTPEGGTQILRPAGTTDVVLEFGHGTLALVTKEIVLSLRDPGAVIGQGREERQKATYKVTQSDASTVWLEVTSKKKDGNVSVHKMAARFMDKDSVTLTPEGESTGLLLTRVK